MDALFVGFLTTYSHTYSAAQKMLAAYYARRYITSIAATHRSDRVSGSAVTLGSLTTEGDVLGGMLQADAANGIADVDLLG